jgi:hypothetical protein
LWRLRIRVEGEKAGLRLALEGEPRPVERARSWIARNGSSAAVTLTGGEHRPEDRITEKVGNSKRLFRRRRIRSTIAISHSGLQQGCFGEGG